ncbi:MAG: 30S ribosomal protein S17 [Verrucomicrobia bacterium]|jgi:small subunit ribosomal protein S17|nr:30S ribosomal protein S17 [Verrucomicrobiota bacterium]
MQQRKVLEGVVSSNKMKNTVVVKVTTTKRHPKYGKVISTNKKFYAHTDADTLNVGDKVTIEETRPLSKLKRWRVTSN